MFVRSASIRVIFTLFSQRNLVHRISFPSTSPESTNQLIKTLTYRGNYDRAFQLFDQLIKQNNITIISLLTILETCTRSGQIERAKQIEKFINQSKQWKDNIRLQTSLIKMHMKNQKIDQGNSHTNDLIEYPSIDFS